jgi:hypothetical protein
MQRIDQPNKEYGPMDLGLAFSINIANECLSKCKGNKGCFSNCTVKNGELLKVMADEFHKATHTDNFFYSD